MVAVRAGSQRAARGEGPGTIGAARGSLRADPRLARVGWRDLVALSRRETAVELLLTLPWLAGSLAFAAEGLLLPAALCSFVLFNAAVRQAHGAMHTAVGLTRRGCDLVLLGLSVVVLGSLHAVRVNHLRHHARCMEPDDAEGIPGRMSAPGALAYGPVFAVRQVTGGLRHGTRAERRWIAAELALSSAWAAPALLVLHSPALRYHAAAMLLGHCLTAFFLVWMVHRGCEPRAELARTWRGPTWLFLHMFHHLEHHLFPAVPTPRLPELARRIDVKAPELRRQSVFARGYGASGTVKCSGPLPGGTSNSSSPESVGFARSARSV